MELLHLFGQIDRQVFTTSFAEEEMCLAFLAAEKWKEGYVCRKCGHTNYCKGKKSCSRRCTRCKHEESATAHTIFHHCRIPLPKAFEIAFLVCTTPDLTVAGLAQELATRQMTCWKFRKQVLQCLEQKRAAIPQYDK
jgi:two-component system, sensor histidine kinase LadS